MAITHAFVSPKADGVDTTKVRASNWNADHVTDLIETTEIVGQFESAGLYGIKLDGASYAGLGGRLIFANTGDFVSPLGTLILDGSREDTLVITNRQVEPIGGWQTLLKICPDGLPAGYRAGVQVCNTADIITNVEWLDFRAEDTQYKIQIDKLGTGVLRPLQFWMGAVESAYIDIAGLFSVNGIYINGNIKTPNLMIKEESAYGYAIKDLADANYLYLTCEAVEVIAYFQINYSTDSTTHADAVRIGGFDISAGHRALAIGTEEIVVAETDETKFSHKFPVRINGATYNIMLCAT
jgi:hypothetical protein